MTQTEPSPLFSYNLFPDMLQVRGTQKDQRRIKERWDHELSPPRWSRYVWGHQSHAHTDPEKPDGNTHNPNG